MTPFELWNAQVSKLNAARSSLADFEAALGELALTNDATELAQRLNELRSAVTVAEAAEATARRNAPSPRVEQKRGQLANALAQVAHWKNEAETWSAKQQELEPAWINARDRALSAMRLMMTHEHAAESYQGELGDLTREDNERRQNE